MKIHLVNISDRKYTTIRKMFSETLYGLSLSENMLGITHDRKEYYRGILTTVVAGIMQYTGCSWYQSMIVLHELLPIAYVNLSDILSVHWHDILTNGKIDTKKCQEKLTY